MLFYVLQNLCKEHNLPIKVFKLSKKYTKPMKVLLKELKSTIGWRGTLLSLHARIKKVTAKSSLTTRDRKLLSKLINQQRKTGIVDYEQIEYYFPGKTAKELQHEYETK